MRRLALIVIALLAAAAAGAALAADSHAKITADDLIGVESHNSAATELAPKVLELVDAASQACRAAQAAPEAKLALEPLYAHVEASITTGMVDTWKDAEKYWGDLYAEHLNAYEDGPDFHQAQSADSEITQGLTKSETAANELTRALDQMRGGGCSIEPQTSLYTKDESEGQLSYRSGIGLILALAG